MSPTINAKAVLIVLDHSLARLFLIVAAFVLGLMILALPPEGLFFGLPFLLLLIALIFGLVGGLFLLAARALKRDTPWQWMVQVTPFVLIGCVVLLIVVLS